MAKKRPILDAKKNLATGKVKEHLLKYYQKIQKGFENQRERADDISDYWDVYNCKLTGKQFYSGNSQVFVPIVKNAIDARATRFTNQLFPKSGRYIEVTTNSGDVPYAHMALLNHYVRKAALRTKIAPALMKQGDIEGQYTVNVTWKEHKRFVRKKVKKEPSFDSMTTGDIDAYDDIVEETVMDSFPDVEIIADSDVLILPATSDTVEDALNKKGGSVTILMRMEKHEVKEYVEDGIFDKEAGTSLSKSFGQEQNASLKDTAKENAEAAGIKTRSGKKYALVYQTWKKLEVEGEYRLCVTYYGGKDKILGSHINPYWNDRCPIISVPVERIAGNSKGMSQVGPVANMQYGVNDAVNEGLDSLTYTLLPIVMTDPEKNPRVNSMIMAMAAIWETSPADTKVVNFPAVYTHALEVAASLKNEIFQTLSVNPAIMPNSSGGAKKKLNQAEIANEQQVDIMSTADMVINLEEAVYTPIIERFFEYDAQFRVDDITIKQFGEMGIRAKMEKIEPLQFGERYEFRWFGVEALRNQQAIQQQISAVNIIRGIPPELLNGRKLDLVPIVENMIQNTFSPELAPLIFKDMRAELQVDPETENEMLGEGLDVVVHAMDDDVAHIKAHAAFMKDHGDETGFIKTHMLKHQKQIAAKQQQMMAQQMQKAQGMQPKGAPGTPGGAGPGMPGAPKPGSVPRPGGGMKAPNGSIHPDQMKDPRKMPRHF